MEIRLELLEFATQAIGPTRLMYASNMSWAPLRDDIKHLMKGGLLERIELEPMPGRRTRTDKRSRCKYKTTLKGQELLRMVKETDLSLLRD